MPPNADARTASACWPATRRASRTAAGSPTTSTDIELRVVGGFLKGNKLPLGDGVDQNDVPFRATFPYVAPPHDGFDSQLKRNEPTARRRPGAAVDPTEAAEGAGAARLRRPPPPP